MIHLQLKIKAGKLWPFSRQKRFQNPHYFCTTDMQKCYQAIALYQRKERETPSPLYIGLKLYANSRQKDAIAIFYALGVSVSYDRIMDVRRDFVKAVSMRWGVDGVVIPTNSVRGVFVTSAVDNFDESGRYEFHAGPWPSPVIRLKTKWEIHHLWITMSQKEPQLNYLWIVNLYPTLMNMLMISPSGIGTIQPFFPDYINGVNDEAWLKHVYKVLVEKQGELQNIPVTYSEFFSHCQGSDNVRPRATVGVFPVFVLRKSSINGNAKTCNAYVKKATSFVNPGQMPVIVGDCPLFAIQKKCQWKYPHQVRKSEMVCMMGFSRIEMASQECGGSLLAGPSRSRMFKQGKICTPVSVSISSRRQARETHSLCMPTYSSMVTYAEAPGLCWALPADMGPSWNNGDVGKAPFAKCPDIRFLEDSPRLPVNKQQLC